MERKSFFQSRNERDFREKLQAKMEKEGLDALILTTPENVMYATGFVPWSNVGRACGSSVAMVPASGRVSLVCNEFEQRSAEQQTKGDVDVIAFPVGMFIEDYYDPVLAANPPAPDPYKTFRIACELAKSTSGKDRPRVGIEKNDIPCTTYPFFVENFGEENLVNLASFILDIRRIKLPWEIDVMRYSAQVAQEMMNRTMKGTEVGMTEADIMKMWYQSAYEVTGGHELTLVNQVHTPGKDFSVSMLPREVPLEEGDIVRLDGGLSIYGYASDIARTYAVGKTISARKQELFDTLLAAHDKLLEVVGPGVRMCDAFNAAMEVCRKGAIPNFVRGHFGHSLSIGTVIPENPKITPSNTEVFEPGMVMCCEVPYYSSENGSYGFEDTVLITENGIEVFTHVNRTPFVK